ncbi:MAG: hypothetical protein ACERKD_02090 [Prolixibacteraceae bacterium]
MKFNRGIIVLLSVFVGMVVVRNDFFGFEEYKKEIILGVIGFLFLDYAVDRMLKFYGWTYLKTKYDLFFRISNVVIGLILLGFTIRYKDYFFDFAWFLSVLGSVGLANGIAYQNSIQLRKRSNKLIVKYKYRDTKEFDSIDSIVYESGKITFTEQQRIVEVNDLKDSEKNVRLLNEFLSKNYPDVLRIKTDGCHLS